MGQTVPDITPTARELPMISGRMGKMGRIKTLLATPCEADPYIAALAGWQATPTLIWSLFGPDCIDLVDDRRGAGHRRRRGVRWKIGGTIPYPGNRGGWGWAVFKLGDLAQRAGWYFAIADATTDWYIHWASLINVYQGCGATFVPYATGGPIEHEHAVIFTNAWHNLGWAPWQDSIFVGGGPSVAIPPGYSFGSMLNFNVQPIPGQEPVTSAECRVVDLGLGAVISEGSADFGEDGTGSGSFFSNNFRPLNPGTTLQTQVRVDHPCTVYGSSWHVTGVYAGMGIGPAGCGHLSEKSGDFGEWWRGWAGPTAS